MAHSIKLAVLAGLVALAAGCARQQEEVVVAQPEPIVAEPTYNKF